jgi:hypothetical protein
MALFRRLCHLTRFLQVGRLKRMLADGLRSPIYLSATCFTVMAVYILDMHIYLDGRDSVVDIVTGLQARRRRWSSSPDRVKNFLFSTSSRSALGPTQPPIQRVPGALSPGVKRHGREADYSPPASVEGKKTWIYTSTAPYTFMA